MGPCRGTTCVGTGGNCLTGAWQAGDSKVVPVCHGIGCDGGLDGMWTLAGGGKVTHGPVWTGGGPGGIQALRQGSGTQDLLPCGIMEAPSSPCCGRGTHDLLACGNMDPLPCGSIGLSKAPGCGGGTQEPLCEGNILLGGGTQEPLALPEAKDIDGTGAMAGA